MEHPFAQSLFNHHVQDRVNSVKSKLGLDDLPDINDSRSQMNHQMTVSTLTQSYFKSLEASFAGYDAELDARIESDEFDRTYAFMYAKKVPRRFKQVFWSGFNNAVCSIDYDLLAIHFLSIKPFGSSQEMSESILKAPVKDTKLSTPFYPVDEDPFFYKLISETSDFIDDLKDKNLEYTSDEIELFSYFNSWYVELLKGVFEEKPISQTAFQASMARFLSELWRDMKDLAESWAVSTEPENCPGVASHAYYADCRTVAAIVNSTAVGHGEAAGEFGGIFESRVFVLRKLLLAWGESIIADQILRLRPTIGEDLSACEEVFRQAVNDEVIDKFIETPRSYATLFPNGVPLDLLDLDEDQKALLFRLAPAKMRDNRDYVEAAIRRDGMHIADASARLKSDPELAMLAIKSNVLAFTQLPEELKAREDIHLQVVRRTGRFMVHAPSNLLDDRDYVRQALLAGGTVAEASDRLRDDKELAMISVRNSFHSFECLSVRLRNDLDVAKCLVDSYGEGLHHFFFRRDDVKLAFEKKSMSNPLQHAGQAVLDNAELALSAVQADPSAILVLSPRLREQKEIFIEAIKRDQAARFFIPENLKHDADVLKFLETN